MMVPVMATMSWQTDMPMAPEIMVQRRPSLSTINMPGTVAPTAEAREAGGRQRDIREDLVVGGTRTHR